MFFLRRWKAFLFPIAVLLSLLGPVACSKTESSQTQSAAPVINSFSPSGDSVGGRITITGENFSTVSSNNTVKFSGVVAMVVSATSNTLVVQVPSGIPASSTITVTVNGQTGTAGSTFTLLSATQMLLTTKWVLVKAIRCDTVYHQPPIPDSPWPFSSGYQPETSFNPATNFLKFTNDGTAYYSEYAWGNAQAGLMYRDTVPYTLSGNKIFLNYPAGINRTAQPTPFAHPAYVDTIIITAITANSLQTTRNYHCKHYSLTDWVAVKKQSIDSFVRQP